MLTPIKFLSATPKLTVNGPALPGQPFTVSWSFTALRGTANNVVATISFNGAALYASQSLPLESLGNTIIPFRDFYSAGETIKLQFTATQQAAQLGLYIIGRKTLTLSVVGDGIRKTPYTTAATLVVIPEVIQAGGFTTDLFQNYWTWTGQPTDYIFDWNAAYTIGGNFRNASNWSVMKAQLTLTETNQSTNQVTDRGTQQITADIRQFFIPVDFNISAQNWNWITCPSGFDAGPIVQNYLYSLAIVLQDPWGNGYTAVIVTLNAGAAVSADKIAHQGNAQSAFGSGEIYAFSIIGAPLAAPLFALAAAECGQAQDPPSPDFDYYKAATPPRLTRAHPHPEGRTNQFPATESFFKVALELVAIGVALSETEGKLIAARSDKDALKG